MVIRNEASAGAAESADVLVTVRPAETLKLRITSTVRLQFGAAIEQTVRSVLRATDVQQGSHGRKEGPHETFHALCTRK